VQALRVTRVTIIDYHNKNMWPLDG